MPRKPLSLRPAPYRRHPPHGRAVYWALAAVTRRGKVRAWFCTCGHAGPREAEGCRRARKGARRLGFR